MKLKLKVFSLIVLLSSCSASWHIKKAIKKEPSIQQVVVDTIEFKKTVVDTIHTSDSTFYLLERVVHYDTIVHYQQYDFSGFKTWFQSWQEEKTERVEIRNDRKIEKVKHRQDGRLKRSIVRNERKKMSVKSWVIIIAFASFLLGAVVIYRFITIRDRLKK